MTAPAPSLADLESLAAARGRIVGKLEALGLDELEVVEMVADGLAVGRRAYGELQLAIDERDFATEAAAELRDAMVYAGAGLLRIRRRGTP